MQPKDWSGGAPTGLKGVPTAPLQVPQRPTFESPNVQQSLAQLLGSQGGSQLMQNYLGARQAFTPKWESTKITDVGWMQAQQDPITGKLGKPELIQADPPPLKLDTSVTDYEDFRSSYPDTPAGRSKAARDWTNLTKKEIMPVVIQTAEGPKLLDKRSGITKPITKEGGEIEPQAPTTEMRNRVEARRLVSTSIDAVKNLSERVITKIGIAQRAGAVGRDIQAKLGNDPEFITYQDSRSALAGNLAVAQQGSRPSDADIKAIWLPLVPDAFRDTKESAAMKWELIKTMSLPEGKKIETPSSKRIIKLKDGTEIEVE